MTDIQKLFLSPDSTIADAISCIDANTQGIALVVDGAQQLIGTIVDGDIRRALLANLSMETPLAELLQRKPDPYRKPVTAPQGSETATLLHLMKTRSVRHIPLLDEAQRVVDLFHITDALPDEGAAPPLQAVVMAGGFGTRLRPLTETLPKPMLPVGDRPLLELTIAQLRKAGIQHINLTTHYMPEKIEEHFGDGEKFGVKINYVPEEEPLGTAGGVGLIAPPDSPLLVMNGDLLTDVNFNEMYAFHREHKAWLTVAVRKYEYTVPYGVVESSGGFVQALVEKPAYSFFVNAGIYLLEPTVHAMIPKDRRIDMTDMIELLIAEGKPVASFPIREYWLDIGQHRDYLQAQEDVKSGRLK